MYVHFVKMHTYTNYSNNVTTFSLYVHICYILSLYFRPDHWSCYMNYLDCQIACHSVGEGTKAGHSPIIEVKDFIRHNKSIEAAKKHGRLQAQYLAELELT